MLGTVCAVVMAGLAGSASCHQELVQPHQDQVSLATVRVTNSCTRVEVSLSGNTHVVTTLPSPSCGPSAFRIVGGAPSEWRKNPNRRLKLYLRVINQDSVAYSGLRLISPSAGKTVLDPPGTIARPIAVNPDSTHVEAQESIWRILPDTAPGQPADALAPGMGTASAMLEFYLPHPIAAVRFDFVVQGERLEVADSFPAVAPDTVPSWFSDDSSYTNGGRGFLRGVIGISFKVGTTPAQKLAAISLVGGTVIGGRAGDALWGGWDGGYYLRISDDGTGTQLKAAVDTLIARPEILVATLIHPMRPFWRRPTDGNNWKPANWSLATDTAIGENWALEAIRAPLAWGCETGSTLPRIWVADRGFDSLPDLAPNILQPPLGGFFRDPGDNLGHGTRVASVVAAVGNNQVGMTGVMWTAALRLRTVQRVTDVIEVTRMLRGVVSAGADIINISGGRRFDTTLTAQANSQIGQKFASDIAAGLGSLGSSPQMPLLVVAAGDDNADADVAGMPGLKTHLPGKVLVVAAAQTPSAGQQRPWTGVTNGGALVDVYAPGLGVAQLDIAGGIDILHHGSSFSAALVTGVAGLLKSFEPSLTPSQLRDFIVQGSTGPGRNGVVDAYASLRRAAEEPGAPLCGNRVWSDAFQVQAQRANGHQSIIGVGEPFNTLRVRHGGRRVDLRGVSSFDWRSFVFTGSGWAEVDPFDPTAPGYDKTFSGAALSELSLSHEGDSAAAASSLGGGSFRVRVWSPANPNGAFIGPTFSRPIAQFNGDSVCAHRRGTQCLTWAFPGSWGSWGSNTAFSPMGNRLMIALSHETTSRTVGNEEDCPWTTDSIYSDDRCVASITQTRVTGNSEILEYLLTSPNDLPRVVGTLSGLSVWDLAISEDGREVSAGVGAQPSNLTLTPDSIPNLPWKVSQSGGSVDCAWHYYSFPTGTATVGLPVVTPVAGCLQEFAGATFAPRKQGPNRSMPRIP